MNKLYRTLLWYGSIGIILQIVQLNLGYIAVSEIQPDVLVIFTVVIALRHGQFAGVLSGFGIGLIFDLISGNIPGTNALAKLLVGFLAGAFFNEQNITLQQAVGNIRFLGVAALTTLLHNLIYYFFYVQPTDLTFMTLFVNNGIAATLYTTALAVLVMLFASRKRE